jgi:hypothetical protein
MNIGLEGSHLSVIETRFSASEYTHVSPTSTQAAQGSGGLPAQRVFRERHRLHLWMARVNISISRSDTISLSRLTRLDFAR